MFELDVGRWAASFEGHAEPRRAWSDVAAYLGQWLLHPPWPLHSFCPEQECCPPRQPPLPLHSFLPLQQDFSPAAMGVSELAGDSAG